MGRSRGSCNSGKRRKRPSVTDRVDYISQLPDTIVLYLLTFFHIKDLIALSMLSRFWKAMVVNHLSTLPSSLKLNEYDEIRMFSNQLVPNPIPEFHGSPFQGHVKNFAKRQFIGFVTRTLMLHTGCTIDNLELCSRSYEDYRFTEKFMNWVVFSFTNRIKALTLDFCGGNYDIPSNGFSPRVLHTLNLASCTVKAATFGVMISLRKLELKGVRFSECNFGDFVSKCPAIEDVLLELCVFTDTFMLCTEDLRMKRLTMIDCHFENMPMFMMNISTPELLSLVFVGRLLMFSNIRNATKLQDAVIQIVQPYADQVQGDALATLLHSLVHCKTISINSWCIQVLPIGEQLQDQLRVPLTHVEHLKMTIALEKPELPGIACLIRSCPNLKMLTLYLKCSLEMDWAEFEDDIPDIMNFDEASYWRAQQIPFRCMETSLKQVKLLGFKSTKSIWSLVRFVMAKSVVLEHVKVYYDADDMDASDATEEQLDTMWEIDHDHALCSVPRLNYQSQVMVYNPIEP